MRTIVSKYGGSSTANAARLTQILALVRASPARRCVVLSAPGVDESHREKVTALLEACWKYRADRERLAQAVSQVVSRFVEIADGLSLPDPSALVRREILSAVGISLPHTLSRGEYLCALLFSRYSGIPMVDAADVIAFDSDGRLNEDRTLHALEALGNQYRRVVLPGFYGSDSSGTMRTFPRNGSDITGALAAAGLNASLYENWTDVPGLMTADPAIVPTARLIGQVGYRQMRALARAGAKVLHPGCLDPVEMAGIPTRLRSSFEPDNYGTLIDEHCDRIAPAIAGQRDTAPDVASGSSQISVFGVSPEQAHLALKALNPIDVRIFPDLIAAYVPPEQFEEAVRSLHRQLIETQPL